MDRAAGELRNPASCPGVFTTCRGGISDPGNGISYHRRIEATPERPWRVDESEVLMRTQYFTAASLDGCFVICLDKRRVGRNRGCMSSRPGCSAPGPCRPCPMPILRSSEGMSARCTGRWARQPAIRTYGSSAAGSSRGNFTNTGCSMSCSWDLARSCWAGACRCCHGLGQQRDDSGNWIGSDVRTHQRMPSYGRPVRVILLMSAPFLCFRADRRLCAIHTARATYRLAKLLQFA